MKQKQKQKVNVKQNVKVVIGDMKRKRTVKPSGAKSGAKPPIVLNLSNPQPNNMFMEYFRKQLQNQQPIRANTLGQQVRFNEQQEDIASRAGALHRIDQEPIDVARELTRQAAETRAAMEQSAHERNIQGQEVAASLETPKTNKKRTPKRKTRLRLVEDSPNENLFMNLVESDEQAEERQDESSILNAIEQQRNKMEEVMTSKGGAGEGAEGNEDESLGVEETKTEIGDWKTTDEQPLGELDAMYNKTQDEIRAILSKKNVAQLRSLAQEYKVPYSRNKGGLLGKPELITNFIKYIKSNSPLPRPGRPPSSRGVSSKK